MPTPSRKTRIGSRNTSPDASIIDIENYKNKEALNLEIDFVNSLRNPNRSLNSSVSSTPRKLTKSNRSKKRSNSIKSGNGNLSQDSFDLPEYYDNCRKNVGNTEKVESENFGKICQIISINLISCTNLTSSSSSANVEVFDLLIETRIGREKVLTERVPYSNEAVFNQTLDVIWDSVSPLKCILIKQQNKDNIQASRESLGEFNINLTDLDLSDYNLVSFIDVPLEKAKEGKISLTIQEKRIISIEGRVANPSSILPDLTGSIDVSAHIHSQSPEMLQRSIQGNTMNTTELDEITTHRKRAFCASKEFGTGILAANPHILDLQTITDYVRAISDEFSIYWFQNPSGKTLMSDIINGLGGVRNALKQMDSETVKLNSDICILKKSIEETAEDYDANVCKF